MYMLNLVERLHDDKNWTKEDEIAVEEHYLRLKEDYSKGLVLHVGRTLDVIHRGFGLVVYQAENDELAETYMQNDPAVKKHCMEAYFMEYKIIFN